MISGPKGQTYGKLYPIDDETPDRMTSDLFALAKKELERQAMEEMVLNPLLAKFAEEYGIEPAVVSSDKVQWDWKI